MSTQDRILESAINLFVKEGIKPVTMDIIASKTGISKRTLYENFRDKQALVYATIVKAAVKDRREKMELINSSGNMIEAMFKLKNDNYKKMSKLNSRFFSDIKRYYGDIETLLGEDPELINGEVTYTLLRRGVNEGVIQKGIDVDIVSDFMYYMFKYFFKSSDNQCIEHHMKIEKSVFLPYIKGLCTEKGLRILEENLDRFPIFK